MENKFDQILKELELNTELDENIENLERYSIISYEIVKQYEAEIVYLKQQVMDLEKLNETLKRECYANTIFIPELV